MAPKPPVFAVDDTEYTDEWQKEVYEAAKHIMDENRLSSVYDIGCGSGYKLLKFMGNFDTTGIDLPETISVVRKRYPDRKWIDTPFDQAALTKADLVICADVIEHVSDPDALMRFIVRRAAKWIVM